MDDTPPALALPGHLHTGHVGPGEAGAVSAPGEDLDTLAGVRTEARVDVEVWRSLETHSIAPPHNQAGTAISHPLQAGCALSARRSPETSTIRSEVSQRPTLHLHT